jgi:hypothetical protein
MVRAIAVAALFCVGPSLVRSQEAQPLGKGLDIGSLADHFTLLSSEVSFGSGGYVVSLKLQAKKDLDPADLFFQGGAFDKSKLLLEAKPLKFVECIPLLKGESIYATCHFTRVEFVEDGLPWHMVYIRAVKKPN